MQGNMNVKLVNRFQKWEYDSAEPYGIALTLQIDI